MYLSVLWFEVFTNKTKTTLEKKLSKKGQVKSFWFSSCVNFNRYESSKSYTWSQTVFEAK